ncbi:MAG: hypothetical protein R2825_06250 [Saprospiraceae bacterium]
MKKPFPIKKAFAALRQIPIEISIEQVRYWVGQQPVPAPKRNWVGLFKDFLFSQN